MPYAIQQLGWTDADRLTDTRPERSKIARYIHDPHASGVYHTRIRLEDIRLAINGIKKLLPPKERESVPWFLPPRKRSKRHDERITLPRGPSFIGTVNNIFSNEKVISNPKKMQLAHDWLCERIGKKNYFLREEGRDYGRVVHDYLGDEILSSDIVLQESKDSLHLSEQSAPGLCLLIDLCSVKKKGIEIAQEFIQSLPGVDEKSAVVWSSRKSHASQWCNLPLVGAIQLWLSERKTVNWVPEHMRGYIQGSLRYYQDGEWRTSVVLSAIAVETLIADIFEEETHSVAPDVPLGALKEKLKRSCRKKHPNILEEIEQCVDTVNEMRISAVHRGTRRVSNEESFNALTNAVKFLTWHYFAE